MEEGDKKEVLANESAKRVLDRMRALCSVREYCTAEIREKIHKVLGSGEEVGPEMSELKPGREEITELKPGREEITELLLKVLKEEEFLSDRRYAAAFARDKAHLLGWGPQKIRYALLSKHIDEEIVTEALALVDQSAARSQLERMLSKKLASLRSGGKSLSDNEIKARLIRFATGRGYPYDAISSAIGKLLKGSLE